MTARMDDAFKKLERALVQLESAVSFRLDMDRRRSDIELELQLMQDDRVKLAEELDGTTNRLLRLEKVLGDIAIRVDHAIEAVEEVLVSSGEPDTADDE